MNGGINTYGYVGGNPVNFVDPLGLEITWSGSMETLAAGEIGGGMKAYFFLTSSCGSDGKKWHVKITASGVGTTYGLPVSASASQIKLTDPGTNVAHPTRLEGPFVHAGGSAGVLLGASLSLTQLGWAQSRGWNIFAGVDISTYDFIGNDAEITWAQKRDCSCSNEDK